MVRKLIGGVVTGVGVALLVLSALADPIGIGGGDDFGWKQMIGVAIGAAAIVVGLALLVRRDQEEAWL